MSAATFQHQRSWRWMSLLFLSLLPLFALFHFVVYHYYTRTLFRPETGDLKRIGYLVGYEDCKARLIAQEPTSGFTLLTTPEDFEREKTSVMFFGDSFCSSLARAYSLETKQPAGVGEIDWEKGNGVAQLKAWLADDWFRAHGIRTVIVERVEYAWLDTFADEGDAALNVPWQAEQTGHAAAAYQKATAWTFANNGNFKVLLSNLAYLVSPTAFKLTDTCVVRLDRKFFDCSYGNRLLFYRGDLRGALTDKNRGRLETALRHVQELDDVCRAHGLQLRFVVPPVKSFLYYDWVEHPFYHDSKLLEALQARATPLGYVDLKQPFHQELERGVQDLYFPDDSHWNFPAAEIAARELTRASDHP